MLIFAATCVVILVGVFGVIRKMLVGYKVNKIAAGSWHSLAITDTCDVRLLARSKPDESYFRSPVQRQQLYLFAHFFTERHFQVYTWGSGTAGQLGHGKLRREVGENLFDGEYDINNPRWIQAVEGFDCLDAACESVRGSRPQRQRGSCFFSLLTMVVSSHSFCPRHCCCLLYMLFNYFNKGGGAHTVLQLRMRSSSQILQRVTQSSIGSGGGGSDSDGFRSPLPPPPTHDRNQDGYEGSSLPTNGEADHESGDDVELDDINFIFGLCRHGRVAEVGELINAGYPVDTPHPTTGNTLAIVVRRFCLAVDGFPHDAFYFLLSNPCCCALLLIRRLLKRGKKKFFECVCRLPVVRRTLLLVM